MALTTSCCLNLSPSTPNPAAASNSSKLSPKIPQHITWMKNEGSWRNRCVLSMACMVIGLEMSNLVIGERHAIAEDMSTMSLVLESSEKVAKWSDKRMCPAWRVNSLETIVPENLPRPSARRGWEKVGYGYSSLNKAPALKVVIKTTGGNCFSM
uniref:Uncharacterized protein n=1 Tax=Fagus sylvatica TaxID=28930 RepID=A0A2N9IUT9_FAGSY